MSLLLKVDIDGVLRDWNHSLIREYTTRHPGDRVTYPFDDFKIDSHFPDCPNLRKFYCDEAPDAIYRNAPAYKGAVAFIEKLVATFPSVWLVSTQFPNTMYPTMEWIEMHIPSAHNLPLIFSKDKGSIGRGKFDEIVLIDDAPHNLHSEAEAGGIALGFGQSYNYGKVDFCLSFFGDFNFSETHEPDRVAKQFQMILQYLHNTFSYII